MFRDRRVAKWLNGLCASFALAAVGAIGYLTVARNRADEPVRKSPLHARLTELRHKGYVAEGRGDGAEAESLYRAADKVRPNYQEVQLALARTLAGNGKRKEAWDLYRRCYQGGSASYRVSPESFEAWAWYADLANEFCRPQEAARLATTAYRNVAVSRGLLSRFYFLSAKNLNPIADAHYRAGDYLLPLGARIKHLDRAAALAPNALVVRLKRASLLYDMGLTGESYSDLKVAKKIARGGTSRNWIDIASALYRQKLSVESRAAFDEVVQRTAPKDARTWFEIHKSLLTFRGLSPTLSRREIDPMFAGLEQNALERSARWVDARDASLLLDLASSYWQPEERTRSRAFVLAAKKASSPRSSKIYGQIASLLGDRGETAEATKMLKEAIPYAIGKDRLLLEGELARFQLSQRSAPQRSRN